MVGDSAGTDISIGHHNTMIGQGTGARTEHASYNTFVGWFAGKENNATNSMTNANRNTYLGARTGYINQNGEDNVGLGAFADYNSESLSRTTFIGAYSEPDNNDVVSIGYSSRVSGQYGIAIGNESEVTGTNAIAIGYQASNSVDNSVIIGNSSISSIGGPVNWTATSDGRFKTDVKENVIGLEFIDRLRPVTYNYDVKKLYADSGVLPEALTSFITEKEKIRYSGFIAQEVEVVANEVNYDFSGVDAPQNEGDIYGLRYAEFIVPTVKAIQELHEKIKSLETTIEEQRNQLQTYQQMFSKLESRLAVLEKTKESKKENNMMDEYSIVLERD